MSEVTATAASAPTDREAPRPPPRFRGRGRIVLAALLVLFAVLGATALPVRQGTAVVLTRFGDPRRVLVEPGLAFKWPAPIERAIEVDLRLRTTSSGLHDVGTKEGLRILVQAYAAWQVPADADHVRLFLRAVRNEPAEAARQLRTFLGSALETATSGFELDELLNTDESRVRLADYEQRIRDRLAAQLLEVYGVTVHQVGIERLSLPAATIDATIERMKAERSTVAEEVQARGRKAAGEIRANADKDARLVKANAATEAAAIDATARTEAAKIYGDAYRADPKLYGFLRSLDVLEQIVQNGTRVILRTDAAPFRVLIDGPDGAKAGAPAAPSGDPVHR